MKKQKKTKPQSAGTGGGSGQRASAAPDERSRTGQSAVRQDAEGQPIQSTGGEHSSQKGKRVSQKRKKEDSGRLNKMGKRSAIHELVRLNAIKLWVSRVLMQKPEIWHSSSNNQQFYSKLRDEWLDDVQTAVQQLMEEWKKGKNESR